MSHNFKLTKSTLFAVFFLFTIVFSALSQVNTGGTATTSNHNKQIIGYLTEWDAWKTTTAGVPGPGALTHLNIDYSKYTIINYSFFGVAKDGSLHSGDFRNKNIYQPGAVQEPADILFTDIYSSWDLYLLFGEVDPIQYIDQAAADRAKAQGFTVVVNGSTWSNPTWGLNNKPLPLPLHKETGAPGLLTLAHQKGVKVVASIGGWSMCKHFPEMAASATMRAKFIADCKKLIAMGFDGIDLDWEYPGPYSGMNFTGTQADFANFTTLVQEIRNAIGTGKIISAAISADPVKVQGLEWSKLAQTMDYFNMMTYDYNGGWSNIAGHNSPLYNYTGAEASTFNWKSILDKLTSLGVPKSKINMGSPFYGRGVICSGTAALNAPTVKRSETVQPDGPITTCADYVNWPKDVYDGTPNYFFIKQKALASGSGWTRHWDDQAKVPYLTNGSYFLSYDDEESMGYKAQFIVDNQLAGTIIWTTFGDLEISGTSTDYGTKLKRYSTVKSVLVNKLNEVFANGGGGNKLPVVSITSPANNATFTAGANVTIAATASDSDGTISKVEFFNGATSLGIDTSSPYSIVWNNVSAGSYTITAVATDNKGGATTSTGVSITVNGGGNTPPTVSITSPTNNATFTTGANITISANASDSDGTVSKVEFFNGTTSLGIDNTSPYSIAWNNVAAGSYTLTAVATDNGGLSKTSNTVTITIQGVVGLPSPWVTQDIGITNPAGSATYTGGTFTVSGAGADIWGTADQFRFVYQPLNGNGEIVARVASLTNTNAWAKAGVMVRETLAANAKNAMMLVSPTSGTSFQRRTTAGGTSTSTKLTGSAPLWVRIVRNGNTLTGYQSANGTSWTQTATASITLATSVYIGLAVTSHNATQLCAAQFTNVTVTSSAVTVPAAPSNLSATAASGSQINLSWTDNSTNESLFRIERSSDGASWASLTTVGANITSYQNTGLSSSTKFYYRVRAENTAGNSTYTNTASATTTSTGNAPAAPGNLVATVVSTSQINLTWTDNSSNETLFRIERSSDGATWASLITTSANSVSYSNTGLTASTTYYYRVRAENSYGNSGYSNIANATTQGGTTGCSGLPVYPAGRGTYKGGDRVTNIGNIYECKPWPYDGWANSTGTAYEPGVGYAWQDAWIYIGACGAAKSLISDDDADLNSDFTISPNPVTSLLTIIYIIQKPTHVLLTMTGQDGQKKYTMVDMDQESGTYNYILDVSGFSAGSYIINLVTETSAKSLKTLIVK